jgi:hypothetical protein
MIFAIQQNRLRIAPAHQLHVKGSAGRGAEGTADPQTAKLVVTAFLGDFWQWEIWGRNGGLNMFKWWYS